MLKPEPPKEYIESYLILEPFVAEYGEDVTVQDVVDYFNNQTKNNTTIELKDIILDVVDVTKGFGYQQQVVGAEAKKLMYCTENPNYYLEFNLYTLKKLEYEAWEQQEEYQKKIGQYKDYLEKQGYKVTK